jgi:hypothetical protein
MKKNVIKYQSAFNVGRFLRKVTKGPHKRRNQRVLSENIQLFFPWWNDVKDSRR